MNAALLDQAERERRQIAARRELTVARGELTVGFRQLGRCGVEISCPAELIDEGVDPLDRVPLQIERIALPGGRGHPGEEAQTRCEKTELETASNHVYPALLQRPATEDEAMIARTSGAALRRKRWFSAWDWVRR